MLDTETTRCHRRRLILLQRLSMVFLLLICITSDYFLYQHVYLLDYKLLRHWVDSVAHGSVAFFSWAIFLLEIEKNAKTGDASFSIRQLLKKCFFNGIIASLLDIDHFISARTLSIAGATHLKGRPFGHTVTFIIVVVLLVGWCSRRLQADKRYYRICFIVIAWFSHQLRDGIRHGLWFWPFGSTPPITYFLYVLMEEGLPFVMEKWWRKVSTPTSMAKVELIFPKVEETIDLEAGEEVNSSNEEEDARLLLSADEDQDIEVLELSKETIR